MDDEGLTTGVREAVLMDLLMGAGFDPHELMAMSYEQCVGLLGRAVSDGRVPAERIDGLRELGLPADTSS